MNDRTTISWNESDIFHAVRLLDLEAGETLDFDTYVYLPTNNKYVKISQAGESLSAEKIDKIRMNKINKLYVNQEHLKNFYAYSATKLRKIGTSKSISPEERTEKLIGSIKELMTDLFSSDSALVSTNQEALKNCSEIISSYILQGPEPDWFIRIQETLGELGDHYSHSGNVSTLAALFSIGTSIGKPEDLALAGLLHDVGKSQLKEIQGLDENKLNLEQFKVYKKHPELAIELLEKRKILLSDRVRKAILQHHETFNGEGFPSGLSGNQICKEAQILAFADQFEYLTKPGGNALTPRDAVIVLQAELKEDPSKGKYDPELLKDLLSLLPVGPNPNS